MSVSVLLPVLLSSPGASEVLFVDLSGMSVYRADGSIPPEDQIREVVNEMMAQQEESMPNIPHAQIREVMSTERTLSMENAEHVFKRRY